MTSWTQIVPIDNDEKDFFVQLGTGIASLHKEQASPGEDGRAVARLATSRVAEAHMAKNIRAPRHISATPVPLEQLAQSILLLRGRRVILDRELATIYGVPTGRLNEAIKRNIERFPADFMFQLTRAEAELSRSQSAILNSGRGQNIKYLPFAFTEHGAIQAANVLNSPRAVEMGIYVVRAFVKLRDLLSSNRELARRFAQLETRLDKKLTEHDEAIAAILSAIRQLMGKSSTH